MMPLPVPSPSESEDKFISRCMSAPVMVDEFADSSQRVAVCQSQCARQVSKSIFQKDTEYDGQRTADNKLSKPDAGYRCTESTPEVRCGTGAYYDGKGGCAEVSGDISENCVSNNWRPRQ